MEKINWKLDISDEESEENVLSFLARIKETYAPYLEATNGSHEKHLPFTVEEDKPLHEASQLDAQYQEVENEQVQYNISHHLIG